MDLLNSTHASFEQPVGILLACHGQVRRFCRTLGALPDHLAQHGVDDAARHAIVHIRRYFNQAAPLHHQDEEDDFFPLLLQYCPQAAADVASLQIQHGTLDETWGRLDDGLASLLSGRHCTLMPELTTRYARLYAQHMGIEEPWFAQGLAAIPPDKLAAAGKKMAARRR